MISFLPPEIKREMQMKTDVAETLRFLLSQDRPSFLMEVHDGVSTKIAQRSGFKALWASSFACSTALGLPDDDSLSESEVIDYLRPIIRSSAVPVLVDGNCGFSSPEETSAFVKKLVAIRAAGVCFEDKQFPKANTFFDPCHPLRDATSYCELLKFARNSAGGSNLCIVARTEGLVAQQSTQEVVSRCQAYCEAGAEAIFVSWIRTEVDQLSRFIEIWAARKPLLINPTGYLQTLPRVANLRGVAGVVWANQNIRACVKAMSSMCTTLLTCETANLDGVNQIDGNISSMADIFELIGYSKK
jgi:phosphoenolpyruvate phosphomutase